MAFALVSGASHSSRHSSGSEGRVATKRSSRLTGASPVSMGGMNAACPSVQNGVLTQSVVHHLRHLAIVAGGTPRASSWRIAAAEPALARVALTVTMIAPT